MFRKSIDISSCLLPCSRLRAPLQRTPLPRPCLLPLPHENHPPAHGSAEQLLLALSRYDPAEGSGQPRRGGQVHGGRRPVRADHQRRRPHPPYTNDRGGTRRNEGEEWPARPVLLTLRHGSRLTRGHPPRRRSRPGGRQSALPAHAQRHRRPARRGLHRQPLRTPLHRPQRLPTLLRRARRTHALVQSPFQPIRATRSRVSNCLTIK